MTKNLIWLQKGERVETDKYGHKAMLEELNKIGRCPRCERFYIKGQDGEIVCPNRCEGITDEEWNAWEQRWSKWSKKETEKS